jgi:hypothetical protein
MRYTEREFSQGRQVGEEKDLGFSFFLFWVDGRKENTWIVGGKGKDDDDDDDDDDNESNLTRGAPSL